MGEDREVDYFGLYDDLRDVRFSDLNDLIEKLNETIELLNDLEKRVGHATGRV